jgi:hypothetical protein
MPELHFSHPQIKDLVIKKGIDEVHWGYNLNVANFPTYGGEVVQILSVYIDDLIMGGTVATYKEAEAIYSYFAQYFTIASQGSTGTGSYNQTPMTLTYAPRGWTFSIQPLGAPGFIYDLETIAPEWQLQAHIKDETAGNYETLQEMIQLTKDGFLSKQGGEPFPLKGIISAAQRDPLSNPFVTPLKQNQKNHKFEGFSQTEKEATLKKLADYYNSLLPTYLEGNWESLWDNIGASGPATPKQSNLEKTGK